MRIGVFLPNWIGDVVMATPALRAVRTRFGDQATLVGVMRPYVSDVLAGADLLDQSVEYDRSSWVDMGRLVTQLRQIRLDALLLFTNSLTTGVLARLTGCPRRIGFAMHGRGWMLTDRLRPARDGRRRVPRSAVDHYLDVVAVLGCYTQDRRPRLATTVEEERLADRLWQRFGWISSDRVVVLNTGGAYGAAKTWPPEHFANLSHQLIGERDVKVLLLTGPAERDAVRNICRYVGDSRVQSLADQPLSIGLSKACVRRSCLMVTTDSGPRHFAAAFGLPAVTLFGPTDPRWSANYNPISTDLYRDMACRPCGERTCPLEHHGCMRKLTVKQVAASAIRLLDADAERAA